MREWLVTGLQAALMGVVQGITEYLPISSTGHLILLEKLMGAAFHESFIVVIQIGTILAVLVEYRPRFQRLFHFRDHDGFSGYTGWLWLGLTTLPAVAAGLLFHGFIKAHSSNQIIAWALFIGGIAMILLERFLPQKETVGVDGVGWKRALGIGCFQCLALIPGTSRSMSTIMGGRLLGLDRRTAAEYSFFAAVPVLLLAGIYDFYKGLDSLQWADAWPYLIGLLVSFVVGRMAIRFLMRLISNHTFEAFGWYRIALAVLIWFVSR